MAQILDTQVSGGGAYILDTQDASAPVNIVGTVGFVQGGNTVAVAAIVAAPPSQLSISVSQAGNTVAASATVAEEIAQSAISVVQASNTVYCDVGILALLSLAVPQGNNVVHCSARMVVNVPEITFILAGDVTDFSLAPQE